MAWYVTWVTDKSRAAIAQKWDTAEEMAKIMTRQHFTEAWLSSFPALQAMQEPDLVLAQEHVQFVPLGGGHFLFFDFGSDVFPMM